MCQLLDHEFRIAGSFAMVNTIVCLAAPRFASMQLVLHFRFEPCSSAFSLCKALLVIAPHGG